MKKIWILFSYRDGWNEGKDFQNIFWEEPHLETLREYFTNRKGFTSELLDYDFFTLLKGNKIFLYGEYYWIETFTEPVKQISNESIKIAPGTAGLIYDTECTTK